MIRRALDRLRDFLPMLGFRRAVAPIIPPQLLEEIAATEARRKFALADAKLSPLERLIHWWGDDAQPGATDEDMQALEQKYAIRLPGDFRAYLMATMPKGNDWDAEGTNWWALGDLKSVREERADWDAGKCPAGDDKMIVFADFMIRGFAWAVDCSEGENRGSIVLLTGDENPCIADSFDQFLDRYLLDVLSVMQVLRDAAVAMELGCDGVLMNTAIAEAKDPVMMARAMRLAVESGRLAYRSGRMGQRRYADPSSPLAGLI